MKSSKTLCLLMHTFITFFSIRLEYEFIFCIISASFLTANDKVHGWYHASSILSSSITFLHIFLFVLKHKLITKLSVTLQHSLISLYTFAELYKFKKMLETIFIRKKTYANVWNYELVTEIIHQICDIMHLELNMILILEF